MKCYLILSLCMLFLDISQANINKTAHDSLGTYIDVVNAFGTTWEAGLNFGGRISLTTMIRKLGTLLPYDDEDDVPIVNHFNFDFSEIPETFDLRKKWPECHSLHEIRNQGACGSCWAFAAVEVMTDRQCIHSNGTRNFHYSANDVLSCCNDCGLGCRGGYIHKAFIHWIKRGVVSGGSYGSHEGCSPYQIPDEGYYYETPDCIEKCEANYATPYSEDLHYGRRFYKLASGEKNIIKELNAHGPVATIMKVYKDFFDYKKGIYQHKIAGPAGLHAIKIVGYGIENEVKYWLVANSWGKDWGEEGFFKILRGVNECEIETEVYAGLPDFY